uniref:Si:ch211-210p4.6 n=1 Tax=Erpetoichthys calabaricus TaxID=27687 RepID=A0A8C4RIY7_ERPCA
MAQKNGFEQEKNVDLSRKKLKALPENILGDTSVVQLDLDRNKLKTLVGIEKLRNLRCLILSKNEFSVFPQEISLLQNLEKLYLNQNKLQVIPEGIFNQLHHLKLLKLSLNRLQDLPGDLGQCSKLQYINVSHNLLKEIPVSFLELRNLEELYLEDNKLQKLPPKLFENKALQKFSAARNPLSEPPDEICAGGLKQIRSYFSQISTSEADYIKRVKTMFLGCSMAGKSTLCRSLKQQQAVAVELKDRTIGIEITETQVKDFRFHFWDFAGQEEYYLTHHVFITPQALVILVINLASYQIEEPDSFKKDVAFWINNILMRVPDSVVLPVGTHVDKCSSLEVMMAKKEDIEKRIQQMMKKMKENIQLRMENFSEKNDAELFFDQSNKLNSLMDCDLQVLDLVLIDCTNIKEIKRLQNRILEIVQNKEIFPSIEKKLPYLYKMVESTITDLLIRKEIPEHGIVPLGELLDKINENGGFKKLIEDDLKDILRYLHRIGIIMWYEEISTLAKTIFVKPSFLITLFKLIVRHDLVEQLEKIPKAVLVRERALEKDVHKWIRQYRSNAILDHKAVSALVKHLLQQVSSDGEDDILEEITGNRGQKGKLFNLLEHFEICLAMKPHTSLNPNATVFHPGRRWDYMDCHSNGAYLFPSNLRNAISMGIWKNDKEDDIRVLVYFLPEVPQGFFARLIIRTCSLFSPHWVGFQTCLVVSNSVELLIKEKHEEDQFMEIRCRRPRVTDLRFTWDLILAIIFKLKKLSEQWPGLYYSIRSPCRTKNCHEDFPWPDQDGLSDYMDMAEGEVSTCSEGHRNETELLFPKAERCRRRRTKEAWSPNVYNINATGNISIGTNNTIDVKDQNFDS